MNSAAAIEVGTVYSFFLKPKLSWLVLVMILLMSCAEDRIDFSSQVKPILNKRCISCHGGVKRNAKFSLLFREEALDTTESGKPSIIPGHADQSELVRRIMSKDPEVRMPYKEEPLSEEEISILKKWIDQGAQWGDHWAYTPPKKSSVPSIGDQGWSRNEIDHFVLEKIQQHQLTPSPEAEKRILLRRVYMDLTGIPPTPAEVDTFINDKSEKAFEKVVDQLLSSPRFGEKWASWWLDLARYADTKGYERDAGRNIWRYRDWVIQALNSGKPYDEFTVEQLAGDLMPNPTDEQLIATAFHRNTMNNDEGGTEDEEFRVASMIDRVNTTYEVWQSTTLSCVQCHTHPYDPFVHEEYYKSMAFFNNTRDEDTEGEHPNLRTYSKKEMAKLDRIRSWIEENAPSQEQALMRFIKTTEPKVHPHDFDQFVNGELIDTKWLGIRPGGSARLRNITMDGKDRMIINYNSDKPGRMEITLDSLNGPVISNSVLPSTGWPRKAIAIPLLPTGGVHDLYFKFFNKTGKPDQVVCSMEWLAFRSVAALNKLPEYDQIDKLTIDLLNAEVENTPVLIENTKEQRRTTNVFTRGNWLVKGDAVEPSVPKSLNEWPKEFTKDRLGFAKWLVHPDNPLTSRAIVNRIWEQLFGTGIVETLEDFGTQGAIPSHPELLDWLSVTFMKDMNWNMKALMKKIVMSATYRQDSRITPKHQELDPSNKWLARAPRVRLSAEQIRDQALSVSGLLSNKMYGKSVMPYQPEGIWNSVWSNEYWKKSKDEDEFRRSVYTYIKRTSPYPAMMMFDGSSREVCLSRRIRTNTPLQALVTLNDSSFVAASRALADKMLAHHQSNVKDQISYGYTLATVKQISEQKLKMLEQLYDEAATHYKNNVDDVVLVTARKESEPSLAALTVVSNAILNLDEVLTKE